MPPRIISGSENESALSAFLISSPIDSFSRSILALSLFMTTCFSPDSLPSRSISRLLARIESFAFSMVALRIAISRSSVTDSLARALSIFCCSSICASTSLSSFSSSARRSATFCAKTTRNGDKISAVTMPVIQKFLRMRAIITCRKNVRGLQEKFTQHLERPA